MADTPKRKTKIVSIVIAAFFLFVFVRCTIESSDRREKEGIERAKAAAAEAAMSPAEKASAALARTAKERKEQAWQESVALARAAVATVRAGMKDPSSFSLSEAVAVDSGAVCLSYRAKNSFGAIVPGFASAASGAKAVSTSATDWNRLCGKKSGSDLMPAL